MDVNNPMDREPSKGDEPSDQEESPESTSRESNAEVVNNNKIIDDISRRLDLSEKNLKYWQEKYTRLLEEHRKLLSSNQNLEEKLITLAETNTSKQVQLEAANERLKRELYEAQSRLSNVEQMNRINEQNCNTAIDIIRSKGFIADNELARFTDDIRSKLNSLDISQDKNSNAIRMGELPRPLPKPQQQVMAMPTTPSNSTMHNNERAMTQAQIQPVTTNVANYDYSSSPEQKGSVMTV